jgi:hypothetical protein
MTDDRINNVNIFFPVSPGSRNRHRENERSVVGQQVNPYKLGNKETSGTQSERSSQ